MSEVLSGRHFWYGNTAIAEGAIAAGCRFFAGYPITPASEIAERISERFPEVGGVFIQFEDEIASMSAILGASWAGKKAMTATSGPGISLMQENFGLGVMMEVPVVQVDVQRGAPSTGLPTLTGQGDVMQVKWGSHGPYEIIALSPDSPQEAFDLTIEAFNFAEKYRVPTVLLTEEAIGHSAGKVVVPEKEEIDKRLVERKKPTGLPEEYIPYKPDEDLIPPMAAAGDGYEIHTTGLTHNEKGFPDVSPEAQQKLVGRLNDKIRKHRKEITEGMIEERFMKDAEIAVVAYGCVSGPALRAVQLARKNGIKAGLIRLKVVWPFPESYIHKWAGQVEEFIVPEINYGQVYLEVKREAGGEAKCTLISHMGGDIFTPRDILRKIEKVNLK
ncbi:MAG: 2-oxoacid:acceptor oxidoreductase subunit alpha [Candidatus Korarchaeota archaeon]|nr:2-oxoacid:acceptor oxidoreductase subunit alpha [Candidatus Korarchaeota archaeon]NIU83102.1 2-oxoacid:acceptor oxidoreductase subunit alpha [Candidatus Thorarchaeota archaeon]NIW13480.1 2-oxoacid:acceptor oxidoreductase subunit alpha [Candidatus Thorarchaeota archaeon]